MLFGEFAKYLEELAGMASRNEMTGVLARVLLELSADEVNQACYLALGRLAPLFDRVEFNLADKMVVRALGHAFEVDDLDVSQLYKQEGDLGLVAHKLKTQNSKLKTTDQNSQLSVSEVFDLMMGVALDSGEGSQERKVEKLAELLRKLDSTSAKYVVRMVLGRLRLGFSDKTVLDALSVMEVGDKSRRKKIEEAYQLLPDVGRIAQLVKLVGSDKLSREVGVVVGVPVMPALAQRLRSADEMIKKMGKVAVEPKYDGTRVQIHFSSEDEEIRNNIKIKNSKQYLLKTFTRNLDENSHMFPELKQGVEQIGAESVILDGEAVGVDPETGELLPFQMTITRKRKHGVKEAAEAVPLKFFVFDILYCDGESLVERAYLERRKILESVIGGGEVLVVDPYRVTDDPDELRKWHQEFLDEGLEGAVIKKTDGPYTPGRRGWNWVKFKEVEEASGKLADSIDAVVMGYYRGKGKRAKFGIGAFLVGVRSREGYLTIAKIGTGLADEQWRDLKRRLEVLVVDEKPKEYKVDKQLFCDVWVEPQVVVEVVADEITRSPMHTAGLALRFPRLLRFRDDKQVDQTTDMNEIRTIKTNS